MLPKVELSYVKASAASVTLDLQVLSKTVDVERCAPLLDAALNLLRAAAHIVELLSLTNDCSPHVTAHTQV